jgi:acyl carrier protein
MQESQTNLSTSEWVLNWFRKRNPGLKITRDADLYESGLLDSLGFIELIDEVEEHYSFTLEFDDMRYPSTRTIDGFAALIESKLQGR